MRMDPLLPPNAPRAELARRFAWRVPERFNIATDTVDRMARLTPHALALLEPQRDLEVTFAGMKEASDRLANVFRARGVAPGDRIAVLLRQSFECALVHLAAYKLGAITVPLSVLFGDDALAHRLEDSGARLLVAERRTLERIAGALSDGVSAVAVEALEGSMRQASARFTAWPTTARDPAILLYTSGTTGRPKGALLPHQTLIGHLSGFTLYANYPTSEARFWSPADWAWIGGLLDVLFPAWYRGCAVLAWRDDRFDPVQAAWLLEHHHVTHTFLFPTALKLMRAMGRLDRPLRLDSVHSGGEPLGAELHGWSQENLGASVNEFYGQTEANLLVGNSVNVDPLRPGSMGLPYPGHDVVLLDDAGMPLGPGHVGEIAVRTPDPVTFIGYWRNPEATAAKFVGPFLRTGDLAEMDDDGYLWFTSRADDLIKAAGYRISPFEVEEALLQHPDVAMSAVIGVPDAERGQRVTAFVRLHDGRHGSAELELALQDLVRRSVGHHAYPREVRFVSELPLTTTGKIQRFRLREPAP